MTHDATNDAMKHNIWCMNSRKQTETRCTTKTLELRGNACST